MSKDADKIVAGDVRTASRLIRDIDDGIAGARETLKELYAYTGRAYVVGVTGAPGVGKSTLVDKLIGHLRRRNTTVGVLAVDPTSPFSGGAILGDRIRMQQHATDPGVFIRSMATRGAFGGLTESTRSALDVLDALGKDFIILETVGVGQDEVDVAKSAQTTVVVLSPGMGDEIQAIKSGILEVADIFAINKSDREGAEHTANSIGMMLDMHQKRLHDRGWTPPILKTEAVHDEGIAALLEEIERHRTHTNHLSAGSQSTRKRRVRDRLTEMARNRLLQEIFGPLMESAEFEDAVLSVLEGRTDPYSACDRLTLTRGAR